MRARAIVAFLTAIAFAALLPSSGAAARARPASRQLHPAVRESLNVHGSNGFRLGVTVEDRRRLTVSVARLDNALEAASYALRAQQRRGSDDIVARLGKLGRIDLRFVPHKVEKEKPPRGCRGGKIVNEQGYFVGLIAFHGERGYTRVRAHRVAGTVSRAPAMTCRRASPKSRKQAKHEREMLEGVSEKMEDEEEGDTGLQSVRLTAHARGHHVALRASWTSIPEKAGKRFSLVTFIAAGSRRRGRIKETSLAIDLFENGSTFLVPNRQLLTSEAIVKPPPPFSGSATFRRHPAAAPSWTGDLKVALPGFGPVRLAGHGTHASMCSGLGCLLHAGRSGHSLLRRLGERLR